MNDAADGAMGQTGPVRRLENLAAVLAGQTGWRRAGLAALLGGLAAVAMPPTSAAPLLLVSFPGLLWLLDRARGWPAFWTGWAFGFGFFLLGLYWIAFALTVDLARFFWLIPFAAAGLPAAFGVLTGVAAVVWARLPLKGVARVVAFALLWAATEWLRGHALTGFPWNLMGYAWAGWPQVMQSVSLFGIYGLSLLTVVVAVLPAAWLSPDGRSRTGLAALGLGLATFAILAGFGAVRLAGATDATVADVRLRVVQANVPQADKWDPALIPTFFSRHREMATAAGSQAPTHVIWPETAVPWLLEERDDVRAAIGAATPPGGLTITGAARAGPPGPDRRFWNAVQVLDDSGTIVASYNKAHLVPFGEYVPFRRFLPLQKITGGGTDFSPGPGRRTIRLAGLPAFSPLICFEVAFPGQVVDRDDRPEWLLALTNDAWFGRTAGPHQHFAIARARAIEEGLPLVRAAGAGISGVVDAYGRILAIQPLGTAGVIDSRLPVALAPTPYARLGELIYAIFFIGLTFSVGISLRSK